MTKSFNQVAQTDSFMLEHWLLQMPLSERACLQMCIVIVVILLDTGVECGANVPVTTVAALANIVSAHKFHIVQINMHQF